MEDLKKIEPVVRMILREIPETRNSDNFLYEYVIQQYNPSALYQPLFTYLESFSELKIPRFESVARIRRKIQENEPELRGVEEVKKWRKENEKKFYNYAKEIKKDE